MNGTVSTIEITAEQQQLITVDQAWHYRIVPKSVSIASIEFYIDETSSASAATEELEMIFNKMVVFSLSSKEIVQQALAAYYRKNDLSIKTRRLEYDSGSDNFLVNLILDAKQIKSSDIHIEIFEESCRVRIRVDGMLIERFIVEKADYPALVNRIKIMSNLDISEKRLPQDGRIFFNSGGEKFDIRVSILPTLYGEKVVLRLLSKDATNINIHKLGFSEKDLASYLEGTKVKQGMILISGPTGSGKTTTLYATLKLLNEDTRNVLTIEDPIEYTLHGINQVQLKESIGLNFGSTLRTFLRQDPDIIMVGEIRDPDTAAMAIRLSLTGHLVLSTIHTNSAWGTISRLVDMGVPAFLLASTLTTSVAQRLIRLLCPHCKVKKELNTSIYPRHFKPSQDVAFHYEPVGCEECYYTGYKGRKAVYEVIPIDYELAGYIKKAELEISAVLEEKNIKTLASNAFEIFADGDTSLEEIYPLLISF